MNNRRRRSGASIATPYPRIWSTGQVEAFSDGVIAVAATLLAKLTPAKPDF